MAARVVFVVLVVAGVVLFVVAVVLSIGVLLTIAEAAAIIAAIGVFIFGVAFVIRDLTLPAPAACALVTRTVLQDTCGGACPPGQVCRTATTRPYGPFGIFGTQSATCACTPVGGGGGGGGTGGSEGG